MASGSTLFHIIINYKNVFFKEKYIEILTNGRYLFEETQVSCTFTEINSHKEFIIKWQLSFISRFYMGELDSKSYFWIKIYIINSLGRPPLSTHPIGLCRVWVNEYIERNSCLTFTRNSQKKKL